MNIDSISRWQYKSKRQAPEKAFKNKKDFPEKEFSFVETGIGPGREKRKHAKRVSIGIEEL